MSTWAATREKNTGDGDATHGRKMWKGNAKTAADMQDGVCQMGDDVGWCESKQSRNKDQQRNHQRIKKSKHTATRRGFVNRSQAHQKRGKGNTQQERSVILHTCSPRCHHTEVFPCCSALKTAPIASLFDVLDIDENKASDVREGICKNAWHLIQCSPV